MLGFLGLNAQEVRFMQYKLNTDGKLFVRFTDVAGVDTFAYKDSSEFTQFNDLLDIIQNYSENATELIYQDTIYSFNIKRFIFKSPDINYFVGITETCSGVPRKLNNIDYVIWINFLSELKTKLQ